ncbi:hypothetical protein VP1G_10677 [Cytospora mali]|uniref:Uncharacterized protein n=1 Tax=Cytospora mali TaxID=578113 RepID=A0A194US10_CYTMA|nr:hypothetical protein VP1G_10677 [Valsa mali var. pyri (nom. inval.)]
MPTAIVDVIYAPRLLALDNRQPDGRGLGPQVFQQRRVELLLVLLRVRRGSELHHRGDELLRHVQVRRVQELLDEDGADGAEVRRGLPEVVLVVLEALGEGLEDAPPELALFCVLGVGLLQDLGCRVHHVGGVAGHDRLEVVKEVVKEAVDALLS